MIKRLSTRLILIVGVAISALNADAADGCKQPLDNQQLTSMFKKAAFRQLELEFGSEFLKIQRVEQQLLGTDLSRFEADADYREPGSGTESMLRVIAWVSHCDGTVIVRGNAWRSDGYLLTTRYDLASLPGTGMVFGAADAPLRLLAYVDSRCPHCHRLMAYAHTLVKEGQLQIELRQVAYIGELEDALFDTRLSESSLITTDPILADADYFNMLGGFLNDMPLTSDFALRKEAMVLLEKNTKTAREILHLMAVPLVLIEEVSGSNRFRKMGYWEMNRLLQPDL